MSNIQLRKHFDNTNPMSNYCSISNWVEFLKVNKFVILCYVTAILSVILGMFLFISPNNTPRNLINLKYISNLPRIGYIQSFEPSIAEEMLKKLRETQKINKKLQMKKEFSERKTRALQRAMRTIQNTIHVKVNKAEEQIKHMIKDALLLYEADKIGLKDYALENFGGSIVSILNTKPLLSNIRYTLFGLVSYQPYSNPRTIIQAEVKPGKCFNFEGSRGIIHIRLAKKIYITAITMEHVAISLLSGEEMTTTPKDFRVSGIDDDNQIVLGQFTYDIRGPTVQTFPIAYDVYNAFQYVELLILNNYGSIYNTCVYRFRVHGQPIVD